MATVAANAQKYIGGDISAITRNETFNPTFLVKNGFGKTILGNSVTEHSAHFRHLVINCNL